MTKGTRNSIEEVMGWEKWGSESLLRVKLREPYEAACFAMTGGDETNPPPAETRTLTERMFTLKELFQAVSDQDYADDCSLSDSDIRKLKTALREQRDKTGRGSQHYRPGAGLMGLGP